jgi:uncharacterized protein (DUF488 family)
MNLNTRKLVKPTYKRQQFLLSFLQEFDELLTATDFQKLLFLYSKQNNLSYYDFLPYYYGCYSIQAAEDIRTLTGMGWIVDKNEKFYYAGESKQKTCLDFTEIKAQSVSNLTKLRGNQLIKFVYEQYPYYAINSKIANDILDEKALQKIKNTKASLEKIGQVLFTIGYEGLSVEKYLNLLILNNVKVLCDVRNNPLSRKFGFSKTNLQKYCNAIGIDYVHIKELGIISTKRLNLKTDNDYQTLFKGYESELPNKTKYLQIIYNLLQTKERIALTCFEHDPNHCHRHVIRDYLHNSYNTTVKDL